MYLEFGCFSFLGLGVNVHMAMKGGVELILSMFTSSH